MSTLKDQIDRLTRTSRGKGRLQAPPSRDALEIDTVEIVPTSDAPGGGGIASPLTEQSRTTVTLTVTDTSDPTFAIDFDVPTQITFADADGAEVIINFTDPTA